MFRRDIPLKDVFATLQAGLQGDTRLYINNLHQLDFAALNRLLQARMVLVSLNQRYQLRVFGKALLHDNEQCFNERNILLGLRQLNAALHPCIAHLFVFRIAHEFKQDYIEHAKRHALWAQPVHENLIHLHLHLQAHEGRINGIDELANVLDFAQIIIAHGAYEFLSAQLHKLSRVVLIKSTATGCAIGI